MHSATLTPLESFLDRPMTPPDADVVAALDRGEIREGEALPLADLDRLLDPAALAVETGYRRLDSGVAYAAVRTEMPAVRPEMVDWWFDWHQRDSLRYQVWFPGAHEGTAFDAPAKPGAKAHWGAVHYPIEDVGLGIDRLWIEFLPPTELGFSTNALDHPNVGTIVCGYVGDRRRRARHTAMVHVCLREGEGLVMRSRFWIGAVIRPQMPGRAGDIAGRVANRPITRRLTVPRHAPEAMARHCADEYANFATLIPELYARYGD